LKNLVKQFSNELIENNLNFFNSSIQADPAFYKKNYKEEIKCISPYEIVDGLLDPEINYIVNSYGHRSDEFVKCKNYVLYSGCSNTTGMAAPFNINWATMLHKKINSNLPFFRLSYCSGGYQTIILNLFKYFKEFGNPETLFLLLPHTSREINFLNNLDIPKSKRHSLNSLKLLEIGYPYPWEKSEKFNSDLLYFTSTEHHKKMFVDSYSMLFILKQYCTSNNINLIYSTWDKYQSELLLKISEFNDMIHLYTDEYYKYIYDNKNRKDKYLMYARDGEHFGILDSEHVANKFYERYKSVKEHTV
jgi:hypothetical protein